jgi:hypothetical protein
MQGNIALRYGQLVAKLWGNVRGPLAPFELRVRLEFLICFLCYVVYLGFRGEIWFISFYRFSTT